MSDLIKITGLSAKGFHGVLDSEKRRGQKFIVDVEMSLSVANLKDDLNKTVNYAQVAQLIHDQITGKSFELIETLAENIAKTLFLWRYSGPCNLWFLGSFHWQIVSNRSPKKHRQGFQSALHLCLFYAHYSVHEPGRRSHGTKSLLLW